MKVYGNLRAKTGEKGNRWMLSAKPVVFIDKRKILWEGSGTGAGYSDTRDRKIFLRILSGFWMPL